MKSISSWIGNESDAKPAGKGIVATILVIAVIAIGVSWSAVWVSSVMAASPPTEIFAENQ